MKRLSAQIVGAVLSVLMMANCGESKSGGGSPYKGISTPAVITLQNARTLSEAAIQGWVFIPPPLRPVNSNNSAPNKAITVFIPKNIPESIYKTIKNNFIAKLSKPQSLAPATRAPVTTSESFNDSYGIGSMWISQTFDNVTGNFSGSVTFNNYHPLPNPNDYLNGTLYVSGTFDINNTEIQSFSISSKSISGVLNGVSISLISFSCSANIVSYYPIFSGDLSFSFYLQNDNTGKVLWYNNYAIHASKVSSTVIELNITGTFYHPDYGYITLTTPYNDIEFYSNYGEPKSGIILATGANNTNIKTTFISNTTYRIEVCDDGDGLYEYINEYPWRKYIY